jgi:hypothetical protein
MWPVDGARPPRRDASAAGYHLLHGSRHGSSWEGRPARPHASNPQASLPTFRRSQPPRSGRVNSSIPRPTIASMLERRLVPTLQLLEHNRRREPRADTGLPGAAGAGVAVRAHQGGRDASLYQKSTTPGGRLSAALLEPCDGYREMRPASGGHPSKSGSGTLITSLIGDAARIVARTCRPSHPQPIRRRERRCDNLLARAAARQRIHNPFGRSQSMSWPDRSSGSNQSPLAPKACGGSAPGLLLKARAVVTTLTAEGGAPVRAAPLPPPGEA